MLSIKLKELRNIYNLSQKEFAAALNVSTSTVGNWEARRRIPDIVTLKLVAEKFSTSLDYLLDVNAFNLGINKKEENLVLMYRELNAEGQEKLTEYADDLLCTEKYIKNNADSMAN